MRCTFVKMILIPRMTRKHGVRVSARSAGGQAGDDSGAGGTATGRSEAPAFCWSEPPASSARDRCASAFCLRVGRAHGCETLQYLLVCVGGEAVIQNLRD